MHFILRMQKKGMFRYLSGDGGKVRNTAMHIINRLDVPYNVSSSPPRMFISRTDPYALSGYHDSFKWMLDSDQRKSFKDAVHNIWKLGGTRSSQHKNEIKIQLKNVNNGLLRRRLKQMINIPDPRWVPAMFGVMYFVFNMFLKHKQILILFISDSQVVFAFN